MRATTADARSLPHHPGQWQVHPRLCHPQVRPARPPAAAASLPPPPTTEHKVGDVVAVRRRQALCVRQRRQRYHRKGGPSENHGYLFRGQASLPHHPHGQHQHRVRLGGFQHHLGGVQQHSGAGVHPSRRGTACGPSPSGSLATEIAGRRFPS